LGQIAVVPLEPPSSRKTKINDSTGGNLSETSFFMKDGHRWVVDFSNGKVSKVQKF